MTSGVCSLASQRNGRTDSLARPNVSLARSIPAPPTMVFVFVYAAGRATPGALLRWGRSNSTGGAGDVEDGASAHRGAHVTEAAKDALQRVKQEAESAMHAITGSKDSNATDDRRGITQSQQVAGGVVATAAVVACIKCASNHR